MTPERPADFARALTLVRPLTRRRLYWTARGVFVSDRAHVEPFDAVFFSIFGDPAREDSFDPGDERTASAPPDDRPHADRGTSPEGAPASVTSRAPSAGDDRRGWRRDRRSAGACERRRGACRQALRRARAARAGAALPADVAPADRDAVAAHPPPRAGAPRPADRPAADPAGEHAHRRRADPSRAPAPARRPPPAGDAVRHLGLDGAVRPRLPAVPDLCRRQRAARGGVRLRHAPDPPHARAGGAPPGAGDPARRHDGAGLVERDPDRGRPEAVQRPPRAPRDGTRRRGRDPLRRLGARRPDARRPRDGSDSHASPTGSSGSIRASARARSPCRRAAWSPRCRTATRS